MFADSGFHPVVVVPTYNNVRTLGEVLCRIDQLQLPVIVVNDGATDATVYILREWQRRDSSRHMVITHSANRGKAAALRTAFVAAKDQFTHAVTVDSDGQHDPEQIPDLLEASRRSPRALVLGWRHERLANCPAGNRWGRRCSNLLVKLECGAQVRDSQSGFRVYPLAVMPYLNCKASRFSYETEVIPRAIWAGCEIVEVPVNSRYFPPADRVSHFKPWRDTLSATRMHVRLLCAGASPVPHSRWPTPGEPADQPVPRSQKQWAALLLGLALIIRVLNMLFMAADSDEPQHLHVVWGWAHGLIQYRDIFDNHAPLFHLLLAPLVRLLGDRADLLIWVRFAMVPLVALTLWATYLVGRSLYSRVIGLWAAVLVALYGHMFMTSIEFRTDNLWAAVWMLTMAVLAAGPLTPVRGFAVGLLLGTCIAISMKTMLLITSLLLAPVLVLLWPPRSQLRDDAGRNLRRLLAVALGVPLVPAALALWFYRHGALGAMFYDVIQHNLVPIAKNETLKHLLGPMILALTFAVDRKWVGVAPSPRGATGRRRIVFLTAGLYYFLIFTFWPLVQKQDYLPVSPMLAIFYAAGLNHINAITRSKSLLSQAIHLFGGPAGLARVAGLECLLLLAHIPHDNYLKHDLATWDAVLRLTDPQADVMDQKGELIFRRRAYDHVLEILTRTRIRNGSLLDDLPQQLIRTDTQVIGPDIWRFSMKDRAFILNNYLLVGPVRVAGKLLAASQVDPSHPIYFDVAIPGEYQLISRHAAAGGLIDGLPAREVHALSAGQHEYLPAGETQLALVLAEALNQGFTPYYADHDELFPQPAANRPRSVVQAIGHFARSLGIGFSFLRRNKDTQGELTHPIGTQATDSTGVSRLVTNDIFS